MNGDKIRAYIDINITEIGSVIWDELSVLYDKNQRIWSKLYIICLYREQYSICKNG